MNYEEWVSWEISTESTTSCNHKETIALCSSVYLWSPLARRVRLCDRSCFVLLPTGCRSLGTFNRRCSRSALLFPWRQDPIIIGKAEVAATNGHDTVWRDKRLLCHRFVVQQDWVAISKALDKNLQYIADH